MILRSKITITDDDFDIGCLMMIQINDDNPIPFIIGAKLQVPIEVGCDLQICPACGGVLSFARDRYFCRECDFEIIETEY